MRRTPGSEARISRRPTSASRSCASCAASPGICAIWTAVAMSTSPEAHYPTLSVGEIALLPIMNLAADDSLLFLWVTSENLHRAGMVMYSWGFDLRTTAFVWCKGTFGLGYWTRKGAEICLLGIRGKPKRQAADVPEVITAPRGAHSAKPEEVYGRIERLVSGPYIELFARDRRPGWDAWGNAGGGSMRFEDALRKVCAKRLPRALPALPPRSVWPQPDCPRPSRRRGRVLMHMTDAGDEYAAWEYRRCGHTCEGHVEEGPRGGTSHRRTKPCPRCNAGPSCGAGSKNGGGEWRCGTCVEAEVRTHGIAGRPDAGPCYRQFGPDGVRQGG